MTQPASGPDWDTPDFADRDPLLDANGPLDRPEVTDSDDLGPTDAGRDPLDDGWDPPDRPSCVVRERRTPGEEFERSMDRQLATEEFEPDPYEEAERIESGRVLDEDVYGGRSADYDVDEAGRPVGSTLVEPDEGAHPDEEADLIAWEAGQESTEESTWPRPAEEDAVHIDIPR